MAPRFSASGKRLGRPPKNGGKVFVSEIPQQTEVVKEPVVIDYETMIECEFLPVTQFSHLKSEELKEGRYMTSSYDIEGFGLKKWVVGVYIKADWEKHRQEIANQRLLVQRCVNYLNSLGKKKKKYGNLAIVSEEIKFRKKDGFEVAIVELSTDERKNENFWGEGEKG